MRYITITESLSSDDIVTTGEFNYGNVIDLRYAGCGNAAAMDEMILRKLKNLFVSYSQFPICLESAGPCQEVNLCETLRGMEGEVLVITKDVAQLAALLNIYGIPFRSDVFYVVETGKGDVRYSIKANDRSMYSTGTSVSIAL